MFDTVTACCSVSTFLSFGGDFTERVLPSLPLLEGFGVGALLICLTGDLNFDFSSSATGEVALTGVGVLLISSIGSC